MIRQALTICWIVLLGICCSHSMLYAQYDTELWKGVEFEKSWGNDLSFSIEEQIRLNNNLSQFKSTFIQVGVKYTPVRYIRVSGGYRYTLRQTKTGQRLFVDLGIKPFRRISIFEPVFRFRYQEDYSVGDLAERYFRPKLSLKKDIKALKLDLSVGGELFYHLSNEGNEFDRYRLSIALSGSLNKRSSITLAYIFQEEFNIRAPGAASVFSVSFAIELEKYQLEDRRRLPKVKR